MKIGIAIDRHTEVKIGNKDGLIRTYTDRLKYTDGEQTQTGTETDTPERQMQRETKIKMETDTPERQTQRGTDQGTNCRFYKYINILNDEMEGQGDYTALIYQVVMPLLKLNILKSWDSVPQTTVNKKQKYFFSQRNRLKIPSQDTQAQL